MTVKNIKRTILPDVSFITTVFNEEVNIIEFLRSLMEQSHVPGEIILVDGGSEDKTFKVTLDFFKNEISRKYGGLKMVFNRNKKITK